MVITFGTGNMKPILSIEGHIDITFFQEVLRPAISPCQFIIFKQYVWERINRNIFYFLVLFFFCFIQTVAQSITEGTAIVAYVIPDSIFIASDSKETFIRKDAFGSIHFIDTGVERCKIMLGKNFGIATAGVRTHSNFNISAYIDSICESAQNVTEAISKFQKIIINPLIRVWQDIPQDELVFAQLQFIVFGFEDNVPVVFMRKYYPVIVEDKIVIKYGRPKTLGGKPMMVFFLGATEEVVSFMQRNIVKANSFSEVAIKTIEIAEDKYSDIIGGNIVLVICTKNGFQWINNKNNCH
jgi:hypothetical protein